MIRWDWSEVVAWAICCTGLDGSRCGSRSKNSLIYCVFGRKISNRYEVYLRRQISGGAGLGFVSFLTRAFDPGSFPCRYLETWSLRSDAGTLDHHCRGQTWSSS